MNWIIITGNLCGEIESHTTKSGLHNCTFRVAVQRQFKNADGERETDFLTCVAWRQSADYLCKYAHKGDRVAVAGRLQTRNYEAQDGSKRSVCEIVAESVELMPKGAKKPSGGEGEFTEVDDPELPF